MGVKTIVAAVACFLLMVGCKPGVPGKYLQPDDMVDILYDYHLAEGIIQTKMDNDSVDIRAYMTNVLRQHGVSRADFDSSMVYYTRHTKLLDDVYNRLADRLDNEAVAHGGAMSGLGDDFGTGSDTTNVWNQNTAFVLSPYAATNVMSYEIKADTSYHAGDKLILDFDAQFLYQDGIRDASVVLAVTYSNDSTEYATTSLSNSSHYRLQVNNSGRLSVKSVRGFWLLSSDRTQPSASATTLKLMIVSGIRLVRMHTKETPQEIEGDKPNARQTGKDSVPVSIPTRQVVLDAKDDNKQKMSPADVAARHRVMQSAPILK